MARLTWQEVSNPNFSGVADSYRLMSDLMQRAAVSGKEAVTTYTQAHADAADRLIQQRMMGVTDPAQVDPAVILGANASRASMGMMKAVDGRSAELVNRSQDKQLFEQTGLNNAYLNTGRDQLVANQDKINAMLAVGASGDQNALAGLASLGLRPDLTADLMTDTSSAMTTRLNQDGTRQRQKITAYDQGRTVKSDTFSDQQNSDAEALFQQGFGIDPANDEAIINAQGWDADRTQRARSRMQAGPAAASAASAAIGAAVGDSPISAFKAAMGQSESSSNYGAANDLGYTGKYQFGNDRLQDAMNAGAIPKMTMAEFKKNPEAQEKAMDWSVGDTDVFIKKNGLDKFIGQTVGGVPVTQDALRGMAHLGGNSGMQKFLNSGGKYNPNDSYINKEGKRVKGTSLQDYGKKFAGVNLPTKPNTTLPSGLMTPEAGEQNQAAMLMAEAANSALGRAANPAQSSLENAGTRDQLSDSVIGTLIPEYEELLGATPDLISAAELVAERTGGDTGEITRHIREVMAEGNKPGVKTKINIAKAAAIVQASVKGKKEGWDFWGARDFFTREGLGGESAFSLDSNRKEALIKDVTSGVTRSQIQLNEGTMRAQTAVNSADQAVNQLLQTLQKAQAAKKAGRMGMDPLIKRLNEQLEAAAVRATQAAGGLAAVQAVPYTQGAEAAMAASPQFASADAETLFRQARGW